MTGTLSPAELRAADVVEAMHAAARQIGEASNPLLWNPRAHPALRRVVMEEAVTTILGERARDPGDYDAIYKQAVAALTPLIQRASASWMTATLNRQGLHVGSVKLVATQFPGLLHDAAREVVKTLARVQGDALSAGEHRAVTGESGNDAGSTMPERLQRITYMRTVIRLRDAARNDDRAAFENLHRLMVHPKGVQLVDAFARSAQAGREFAVETIEEAEAAMLALGGDVNDTPALVWRFPPALVGGLADLGLGHRPGVARFTFAWAKWGDPWTAENVLDIAGNALLALELAGGPLGKGVGEIVDLVLGVIGTSVQFIRDLERDQAGKASGFMPGEERLAQRSSFLPTALAGAAALVAVAVPVVVAQIGVRAVRRVEDAAMHVERGAARDLHDLDARGIAGRGISRPEEEVLDRLTGDARRTADKGTITTGKEAVASSPTRLVESKGTTGVPATTGPGARGVDSGVQRPPAPVASQTGKQPAAGSATGQRGVGPPAAPAPVPRIGRANTGTPKIDTRTAGGGIKFIHERTVDQRRIVEIAGEIRLIDGQTPESIFRDAWPLPSDLGLPGYERCHLFPLQWGDEAAIGFMYAHGDTFNRSFQKRLENYVRRFRDGTPSYIPLPVRVRASATVAGKYGNSVLETIEYEFTHPRSKQVTTIRFQVDPPPAGRRVRVLADFAF